jgi:pimeloyl-ACP methyl ester carboxylesterase
MQRHLADKCNFDVFSHSFYPTRKSTEANAEELIKILEKLHITRDPSLPVHFVAHSYGGAVLLRKTFSMGYVPRNTTKAVFLAPVVRGAQLARRFRSLNVGWVLGAESGGGRELMMLDAEAFERMLGPWPAQVPSLTVLADAGKLSNPLIDSPNDGTLAWADSLPGRFSLVRMMDMYRNTPGLRGPFALDILEDSQQGAIVQATHSTMLWSTDVFSIVADYLASPAEMDHERRRREFAKTQSNNAKRNLSLEEVQQWSP